MILVTGGSGLVGYALCQRLVQLGKEVVSLDLKRDVAEGCVCLVGDVTDHKNLEKVFDIYPFKAVVNLASLLVSASSRDPVRAFRVNVWGSFNLLELCVVKGIQRFVFGSSYSALGDISGYKKPIDETSPAQPIDFYGETKRFTERLGMALSDIHGLEFVSARMPIIVGPGEPKSTSAWRAEMFNMLANGGRLFINYSADETLPLAHTKDMAEAIAILTTNEKVEHSIYHLPYELWRVSDLGRELEAIGNGLSVEYGERRFSGAPVNLSWERMRREFHVYPPSLRSRLLEHRDLFSSVS